MKALDLFAGTGWGVACRWLGIEEDGVEIMPEAIATREANGMNTIYNDVWDGLALTKSEFHRKYGEHSILIASPPCQTFSLAGKGSGRKSLDEVLLAISDELYTDPERLLEFGERHDPRTALVLAPLAYIWRDLPRFVVLEQVPTVQPVWDAYAVVMRQWGYTVETAVLNAEQYGVPQTRRRSILVASLNGPISLPAPTHSKYYSRDPKRLDPGVLPWVSMAEALGWGAKDQPSHTITAGVHGPTDRWASGGNSVRKALDEKIGGPSWIPKPDRGGVDARTTYTERFDIEDVARIQTYPAGAATLQGYPAGIYIHPMTNGRRGIWPADGPAPTIRGVNRGMPPKYKGNHRDVCAPSEAYPRLSPEQAATLQTYPAAPFVWCGTKTKVFLQIGNAVPPVLAAAVLRSVLDAATKTTTEEK